jgi:hypothetical protein
MYRCLRYTCRVMHGGLFFLDHLLSRGCADTGTLRVSLYAVKYIFLRLIRRPCCGRRNPSADYQYQILRDPLHRRSLRRPVPVVRFSCLRAVSEIMRDTSFVRVTLRYVTVEPPDAIMVKLCSIVAIIARSTRNICSQPCIILSVKMKKCHY